MRHATFYILFYDICEAKWLKDNPLLLIKIIGRALESSWYVCNLCCSEKFAQNIKPSNLWSILLCLVRKFWMLWVASVQTRKFECYTSRRRDDIIACFSGRRKSGIRWTILAFELCDCRASWVLCRGTSLDVWKHYWNMVKNHVLFKVAPSSPSHRWSRPGFDHCMGK